MKEAFETKFCENCAKDTLHKATEYALEITYQCTECDRIDDVIKTFF